MVNHISGYYRKVINGVEKSFLYSNEHIVETLAWCNGALNQEAKEDILHYVAIMQRNKEIFTNYHLNL